jgi:hypothetical protein
MTARRPALRSFGAACGCIFGLHAGAALADNCERSRDYILSGASGELLQKAQSYRALYKSCRHALELPNVKDAFILRSGAIAVLPRNDTVSATAVTLANFCRQYPRQTLRFITRQESQLVNNLARVVRLGTAQTTTCEKITGGG